MIFVVGSAFARWAGALLVAAVACIFCSAAVFAAPAHFSRSGLRSGQVVSDCGRIEIVRSADFTKDEKAAADMLELLLARAPQDVRVDRGGRMRKLGGVRAAGGRISKITFERTGAKDLLDSGEVGYAIYGDNAVIFYDIAENAPAAVGEFAERVFRMRVLAPPPLGIVSEVGVPKPRKGAVRFKYSFAGRDFNHAYMNDKTFSAANGRNAMFVAPAHNLLNIIGKDGFEKYPEFMPTIGGRKRTRSYSAQIQPDFLEKSLADFATRKGREFFENNPQKVLFAPTYSDSPLFDESPRTLASVRAYTPRGYTDYGNVVFTLTNYVAERIGKTHPDKFVMEIGYLFTENPPDFRLEKNIITYLCADRSNNYNADHRNADIELFRKWTQSGAGGFGLYDYNYGFPYFVPHDTTEFIADAIAYSYRLGARIYTCETSPVWAYDAHKMWITSRLLKDVSQDPKRLEREYFEMYFGESARAVGGFFAVAKRAWRRDIPKPVWLKFYKRQSQAEMFSEGDLAEMENFLSDAERVAESETVRERLAELRLAFDITKSFTASYRAEKRLFEILSSQTDRDKLRYALEVAVDAQTEKNDAILRYEKTTKYPRVDFGQWMGFSFVDAKESAARRLLDFGNGGDETYVARIFGTQFAADAKKIRFAKNILKNPNFKDGFANWKKFETKKYRETLEIAKGKNGAAVAMGSPHFVGISQSAAVEGGRVYEFEIVADGEVELGQVLYTRTFFLDANGKILSAKYAQFPAKKLRSEKLSMFARAPKEAATATVSVFVGNSALPATVFIKSAKLNESL